MTSFKITVIFCLYLLSTEVKCNKSTEKCEEYSKPYLNDKIIESKIKGPVSTLGKELTAVGEFPHMVALGFEDAKGEILYLCGGSIISERFILTTAVCANKENNVGKLKLVRLGDHNIQSAEDDSNVQIINIKETYLPPSYNPKSVYDDIGLIELEGPIKFNRFVRPACLYQERNLPDNKRFSAIGWGKVNFGEESADKLHKVYLDIFTFEECQESFKNTPTRRMKEGIVDERMICAGGRTSSKDTCKGDSGGPLQYFNPEKNNYMLVGLTSLGRVCGVPGTPSIYTRIQSYIPWIESVVWK